MSRHRHLHKALAASLVLSSGTLFPVTAWASSTTTSGTAIGKKATVSQSEALSTARNLFSIPSNYVVQNESYSDYSGNHSDPVYNFTFQNPDPNAMNDTISVGIDAVTGAVSSYNHYNRTQTFQFPVPVSEQKAEALAKQWAQKLFPKQYPDTTMSIRPFESNNLTTPVQYDFSFERTVSGIPAPFDGFSLTIDQDGHLTSVQDSWHNEAFPTATGVVSQSEAKQVFQNALGLHLAYTQIWHQSGNPTTALAYEVSPSIFLGGFDSPYANTQDQTDIFIDANSGMLLDSAGNTHKPSTPVKVTPIDATDKSQPLTATKVNWSETQALSYAKSTLSLDSNVKLNSDSEWSNVNSDEVWNFEFTQPDSSGKKETQINVGVDATYGYLTQFNEYTPQNSPQTTTDSKNKLSEDKLLAAATAFAKRTFAGHLGDIALQPLQQGLGNVTNTQFRLIGLVNGIEDDALDGSIIVNDETGTITSENMGQIQSQENTNLPSPDSAVPLSAAEQAFAKTNPLQLTYVLTNPTIQAKMNGKSPADISEKPKVVLAYVPTQTSNVPTYFDAVDGKFVADNGLDTTPYTGTIQDISNNPAAPELTLLARRGLLSVDQNGDIHPAQTFTNEAFIKLLMDAFQTVELYSPSSMLDASVAKAMSGVTKNNPSYKELATAYSIGWLDPGHPLNPNAKITRNEAATLLAQALGYNKLLSHPSLFNLSAKDAKTIPQSNLAADAIAVNLGLLSLSKDGNFNGSDGVSVADAAQAVVKAATLMNDTQPGPIHPVIRG